MDDRLREECAEQLKRARADWTRRLDAIRSDRRRASGELSPDFEEQATQRENDETLDALDERGREALAAIDAALGRIADGSYGECARCGERISDERLRAEPTAAVCIGCATARAS